MDFVTIDVETANRDVGSICQIGLAKYSECKLVNTYSRLIQPNSKFSGINIGIHGIDSEAVKDSPAIIDIFDELQQFIGIDILVSYTSFDERAMTKCLSANELSVPSWWLWVDASIMVRKTYQQFSRRGYGLNKVCDLLGYDFKHHDALEDAKACGFVVTTILKGQNKSITDWVGIKPSQKSRSRGRYI